MTFALSSPFIWTLAGITTSRNHFHDWNPISDVLNKVVRTAVIYMYWIGSNSGNMRVINPSWLVINAQLLHAVEQAHIYKLRTDLSYPESLTIWVWLSASMVGGVSWKPIPQLTTYHLKTGSWTNTALVILQEQKEVEHVTFLLLWLLVIAKLVRILIKFLRDCILFVISYPF